MFWGIGYRETGSSCDSYLKTSNSQTLRDWLVTLSFFAALATPKQWAVKHWTQIGLSIERGCNWAFLTLPPQACHPQTRRAAQLRLILPFLCPFEQLTHTAQPWSLSTITNVTLDLWTWSFAIWTPPPQKVRLISGHPNSSLDLYQDPFIP